MKSKISLSPSKLNLFNKCPRCFWDSYADNHPRPRGAFPTLPGGMDRVIKAYFDLCREQNIKPPLISTIPGNLFNDRTLLNRWRNWRTGLTYFDQEELIQLCGALDDCIVDNGIYIPLDYKTKGSKPKDNGAQYYQTQLDCYNLMLMANGYKINNEGYLIYFYPGEMSSSGLVNFKIDIYKLFCSAEQVKEIIKKAANCLRGEKPQPTSNCEYCKYQKGGKQDAHTTT